MFNTLGALAFIIALGSSAAPGLADERGAAAGAVTGAVAGAVVGGPIGAVIGAVVGGAVVGTATGPSTLANAQIEEPSPLLQRRGMVQRQVRSRGGGMVQEPEATGGVVETTCVRDARGNTRCRREVVR
jgi:hypothetical protein